MYKEKALSLEQLREMDGKPVLLVFDFELEPMIALIEYAKAADCIILTNNLGGRSEFYSDEELRESGIKVYAYPPAYIDREAWTAEWKEYTGADAGFHYCSKCGQTAFNYEDGREVVEVLSDFCPSCARAMTPGALAKLQNGAVYTAYFHAGCCDKVELAAHIQADAIMDAIEASREAEEN